jgi:hypothetical protein
MKHLEKILRICGLILFLVLAVAGIGILGLAPPLNKDRKLFVDQESKIEMVDENSPKMDEAEELKF